MQTLQLDNINSFVVISDVHLRDPQDSLTKLFIQSIDHIQNADAVFFMGDIFDFISAPTEFFLTYWKNVFDAFYALKKRNIKVYFTEGNHDFGFEHFTHPRFLECFTKCGDFEIKFTHSVYGNIVLKHGDEVVCTPSYHPFRYLVKSKPLQKMLVLFMPGAWMQAIFLRYAKLSRKRDKYRTLSNTFMFKKIESFLKTYHPDCDIFIMGHVHQNIDHTIQIPKPVRVLIGEAWFDQPNILYVSKKEICRHSIQ